MHDSTQQKYPILTILVFVISIIVITFISTQIPSLLSLSGSLVFGSSAMLSGIKIFDSFIYKRAIAQTVIK